MKLKDIILAIQTPDLCVGMSLEELWECEVVFNTDTRFDLDLLSVYYDDDIVTDHKETGGIAIDIG